MRIFIDGDACSSEQVSRKFAAKRGAEVVRVVSIGENNGVQFGVWAIFEVGDKRVTPLYWREEQMQ